jgi:hypothetical protein
VIFHDGVHDSILQHDDNRVIVGSPYKSALPPLSTTSLHVLNNGVAVVK